MKRSNGGSLKISINTYQNKQRQHIKSVDKSVMFSILPRLRRTNQIMFLFPLPKNPYLLVYMSVTKSSLTNTFTSLSCKGQQNSFCAFITSISPMSITKMVQRCRSIMDPTVSTKFPPLWSRLKISTCDVETQ